MEEKIEALKKEYEETLKTFGLDKLPTLVTEGGKIKIIGKRWIIMNVDAFPEYMIKSTANIMGEKLAREFIYWFGYSYGEVVAERYLSMGIPKQMIPNVTGAVMALFGGWGFPEFIESDLEKGRLVVKVYDDFETESARINKTEPSCNYIRGLFAGLLSKLINAKTHATAEFRDGATVIVVEKR
jgi:predicted hydrocarbon binding protein